MEKIPVTRGELNKIGINVLTGEACALSMRMLCELNYEAMCNYLSYTGVEVNIESVAKSTWNDRNRYAVMMTWLAMKDLLIMHLASRYETVYEVDDYNGQQWLYAGTRDEIRELFAKYPAIYSFDKYSDRTGVSVVGRTYSLGSHPRRGFSNVHAMTGNSHGLSEKE